MNQTASKNQRANELAVADLAEMWGGRLPTWEEFKEVYMAAYDGGASGCTTFRASCKRYGILNASASEDVADTQDDADNSDFVDEGGACYYDPNTGLRKCE